MSNHEGDEQFIYSHHQILMSERIDPIHIIKYSPEYYHDELFTYFEIEKPTQLSQWVPKRQAQFLAGRIAANMALSSDQANTLKNQVGIGYSRQPIWPENFIGSISHSGETSIACISQPPQTCAGLGVDIQETILPDLQSQITSTILTHKDTLLFQHRKSELAESVLFTLMFSAKESFFKAAFNSVGEYFDFTDASIIGLDTENQQLTLKTNRSLSADLPAGFETIISYTTIESPNTRVITACHWEL